MPHKVGDRILDTFTTTGTGDITVTGTGQAGHRTPSEVLTANGDTGDFVLAGGTQWEFVRLTRVSANVYSRGTPYSSSTGSAISFSAGVKEVWGDIPAFFALHLNMVEIAIASVAGVTDISALHGLFVEISGTNTTTGFGTTAVNQTRFVRYSGAVVHTHHATTMICPGGASFTAAAGDTAIWKSDASGNWRCWSYRLGTPATQANVEAETAGKFPDASQIHYSPGVAKGWVKCDVAAAIQASYNVTSVTDVGAGQLTVTWATDFSSGDYAVVATALFTAGASIRIIKVTSQAAGTTGLESVTQAPALTDPTNWFVAAFGDQ